MFNLVARAPQPKKAPKETNAFPLSEQTSLLDKFSVFEVLRLQLCWSSIILVNLFKRNFLDGFRTLLRAKLTQNLLCDPWCTTLF